MCPLHSRSGQFELHNLDLQTQSSLLLNSQ